MKRGPQGHYTRGVPPGSSEAGSRTEIVLGQGSPAVVVAHVYRVAGNCIYRTAIDSKQRKVRLGIDDLNLVVDSEKGVVKYRHSILAECSGNENDTSKTCIKLLAKQERQQNWRRFFFQPGD